MPYRFGHKVIRCNMNELKAQLLDTLTNIEGVEIKPSPVAGGTALFYFGKEFAHFHNDNELDLRLTKKVIQNEGLAHPSGSVHHPTRSPSSPWIELRFTTTKDIAQIVRLVKLAVTNL